MKWRDARAGSLDFPVATAPSRRYLKSPLGPSSGSTQNVCVPTCSLRSRNSLIVSAAVVLANVLGFFEPVRALIESAIKDGFIRPAGVNLVKFVDGPSDHSLHESFDWGKAILEELDSWEGDASYSLGYDWTRPRDGGEKGGTLHAT